ncbi:MAG: hypothetical protein ACAH59_07625 [Pseudobdellovibrionaceae bacterium]
MKPVIATLVGVFIAFGAQVAFGETEGRVSLSQASFLSPDFELTGKKDYQLIGAGLDTLRDVRGEQEIENSLQAHVRGMVAPGTSVLNYLNVSQLYWKQNLLSVGRKKIVWNRLDENYLLGSYQPLFKWNPLLTETQGLTGIFIHLETSETALPWGVTLMGSPLFIPNQGAGYELKDGTFQESNPYFKAPPRQALANEQEFDINYTLQKPEAQDVVLQQSFAGRVFVGEMGKGPFWQVAYARKPMNELNLGFIGYAPSTAGQINVDILPAVSNHTLVSSDLQYASKFLTVGVSGLHEDSEEPNYKSEWTYSTFTSSMLVSPYVEGRFKGAELHVSVLSVEGGDSRIKGPQSSESENFIPQRYPFRNAGLASLKYQYRIKRFENIGLATRYLRGSEGEFDLWTNQISYQWREKWAANLISQLVAVENNSNGRKTAFDSYLNNDLVAIGISYVF